MGLPSFQAANSIMDAVRYYIALLMLVAFPSGISMWFLIHPLAGFWRRRGPVLTYSVVVGVAVLIGVTAFWFRQPLLSIEFGFGWPQAVLAVVCYAGGIALEVHYRRQITIGTLLGLPEVSEERPNVLLNQGIYARVRHPRYLGLLCEIAASAFLVNYLATYVLAVATIPVLYLTVLLEEHELLQRFGDQYAHYMKQVPRFIPKNRP